MAVIALMSASLVVAAPSSLARATTSAAPATTQPGYNFRINVTITTTGGVVLDRNIAKRGWLVHFWIRNSSKKSHLFDVGGLKKTIPAGKIGKIGSFADTRGQYAIKVDKKTRGFFTVI